MMKVLMIIPISILLILLFVIVSCNYEVNTSDPQASKDIASSKKDGFFHSAYDHSSIPNNLFQVKEVWVESVWFNQIRDGEAIKKKSTTHQLNLKLDSFIDINFTPDEYLSKWEMKDDNDNVLGMGNGVFSLSLHDNKIPDTFNISILKYKDDTSKIKISQFSLVRKN